MTVQKGAISQAISPSVERVHVLVYVRTACEPHLWYQGEVFYRFGAKENRLDGSVYSDARERRGVP